MQREWSQKTGQASIPSSSPQCVDPVANPSHPILPSALILPLLFVALRGCLATNSSVVMMRLDGPSRKNQAVRLDAARPVHVQSNR